MGVVEVGMDWEKEGGLGEGGGGGGDGGGGGGWKLTESGPS